LRYGQQLFLSVPGNNYKCQIIRNVLGYSQNRLEIHFSLAIHIRQCIQQLFILLFVLVCQMQTTVSEEVRKCFEECKIDGDLLLLLTEENLKEDFNMKSTITRKKYRTNIRLVKFSHQLQSS